MKDPSYAMQAAIFAKLDPALSTASLTGAAVPVHDTVPDPPVFPYARLGDDQAVGDANGCHDAWEFYATIHIFSRDASRPRPEVKKISDVAAQALGDNASLPAPSGFLVEEVELTQSRGYMEEDGVTAHHVLTFRYLVADGA